MGVVIAPQYTQRSYSWSAWKAMHTAKEQPRHQYDDDGVQYTIWFYDGPDAHTTALWKGLVPASVIAAGYTQEQNDEDKADFEANYQPTANRTLEPRSALGTPVTASAKGLGGFIPQPTNNPYEPAVDEGVSPYVDGEGNMAVRGPTLTDEGCFRDDFAGNSLFTDLTGTLSVTNGSETVTGVGTHFTTELDRDCHLKLKAHDGNAFTKVMRVESDTHLTLDGPYPGATGSGAAHKSNWIVEALGSTPGSVAVADSKLTMSSGTAAGGGVQIRRFGDYQPMATVIRASVSQRIDGQEAILGFRDDVEHPTMEVVLRFNGTDPTQVEFESCYAEDEANEERSVATLPNGLVTSQDLIYKVVVLGEYAALLVNDVMIARHETHVPRPYSEMFLFARIENEDAVGSSTDLVLNSVYFANMNQMQVAVSFPDPVPITAREDMRQADGALRVALVGRLGEETNWATHRFTDPTSWYGESVRVTEETLADSGDGLTFESDHAPWVDMAHGKVWDEEALCADVAHGYAVVVTVDDVEMTARKPFATTGGDYTVDYLTGKITFAASQAGKVVKASYSYATDSTWTLRPYQGYVLDVESAEIQFSQDFEMTGAVVMAYYGDADHFAPGIFPPGTIIEIGRQAYNRVHQFIDEAIGSFPVIGGPTGGTARGMVSPVYGFPFKYGTVRRLWSKWKMEVRVWVEDCDGNKTTPFGGEYATATFYCVSRKESDL